MRRIPLLAIVNVLFLAGCAADEPSDPTEPELDLAWETDDELEPTAPTCAPDQPDCDRLDDADSDDTDDTAVYALTDPLANGKYRAWPHGRIPYKFATTNGKYQLNAATRATVSQAMTNWSTLTEGRVKFRAKTASDTAYVLIGIGSPLVRPFVGYRAGQVQHMSLRQNEFITVAKHELGHVIGLHHEQRRTDRLSFIKVRTANIINTSLCQFQFATCSTCKRIGTYDRISVMHYRTSDLSNCRKGPVLLKLDGSPIDHVWKVSTRDRNAVATMYPAPKSALLPDASALQSGSMQMAQGCLDVSTGSVAVGAKVEPAACDVVGSQDWRTTRSGQLRAKHSLRCAAVAGESVPGASIEQAVCTDDATQQWQLAGMELVNGDTTKCVSVANGTVSFGACTGEASQRLDYRAATETLEAGGACLTASEGGAIVLEACHGGANQRWFQGRGGFVSRSDIGSCLAPAGDRLELTACTDDVDQTWALRGPIRDARAGLCLAGGSLAACTGAADQIWTFWSR
jgi:astacin (peptidase family M12A)/ricin-type beta-trefoil lectin protein